MCKSLKKKRVEETTEREEGVGFRRSLLRLLKKKVAKIIYIHVFQIYMYIRIYYIPVYILYLYIYI